MASKVIIDFDYNHAKEYVDFDPKDTPRSLVNKVKFPPDRVVRQIIFAGKNIMDKNNRNRSLEKIGVHDGAVLYIVTIEKFPKTKEGYREFIAYLKQNVTTVLNHEKIVATPKSGQMGFTIHLNLKRMSEGSRDRILKKVFNQDGVKWYNCENIKDAKGNNIFYLPRYLDMFWMQLISDDAITSRLPREIRIMESSSSLLRMLCKIVRDEPMKSIMHVLFGDLSRQSETGTGAPMPDEPLNIDPAVQEAYDRYIATLHQSQMIGGYYRTYYHNKDMYIRLKNG